MRPTLAGMGGAPKGYDAAAYGRDFKAFHAFIKNQRPGFDRAGSGPQSERQTGVANHRRNPAPAS